MTLYLNVQVGRLGYKVSLLDEYKVENLGTLYAKDQKELASALAHVIAQNQVDQVCTNYSQYKQIEPEINKILIANHSYTNHVKVVCLNEVSTQDY
jgi:hypothetical protein